MEERLSVWDMQLHGMVDAKLAEVLNCVGDSGCSRTVETRRGPCHDTWKDVCASLITGFEAICT